MLNRTEIIRHIASHAVRRRIGVVKLGMGPLQLLQLAHQCIKFIITDLRVIQHVIPVIMVVNYFAETFDFITHNLFVFL